MATHITPAAVIRVSCGNFDPAQFQLVQRMTADTGKYLMPAIRRLAGLSSYFAGASPSGSLVHVSVWESDAQARQMASLREMVVDARRAAEQVGVTFTPIVHYPISWNI